MELVIKTFMGIFFLLLLLVVGTELIGAFSNAENARDYKNIARVELEDSDYDVKVLNDIIAGAKDMDYELKITLKNRTGNSYVVDAHNPATLSMVADTTGAEIELKYFYNLPLFDLSTEHYLYDVAR